MDVTTRMRTDGSGVTGRGSEQTGTELDAFIRAHGAGLVGFAYVLTGDRGSAQDLVQDAYLALYRRFGRDLAVAAPVAYARRVVVNAHISRTRRRAHSEIVTDDLPEPTLSAGRDGRIGDTGDEDAQDEMWRLLADLPARQRAVLVMRFHLDLPDPEIAAQLGCREGTVRSLASRGLATLRARHSLLTPEGSS